MSYTTKWRIKGTETGGPTMLLRQTEAEINFDEGPSLTLESNKLFYLQKSIFFWKKSAYFQFMHQNFVYRLAKETISFPLPLVRNQNNNASLLRDFIN